MKRTIITVVALLLSSVSSNQQFVAHADISDMVLEEEYADHRLLVDAKQAKAMAEKKKEEKVAAGKQDEDDDSK